MRRALKDTFEQLQQKRRINRKVFLALLFLNQNRPTIKSKAIIFGI